MLSPCMRKKEILIQTKLHYLAVYPNAMERQKVALYDEEFNEKTATACVDQRCEQKV